MEAVWDPPTPARGAALLLEHCAALERLDQARLPARDRLMSAVGDELAGLLLRALSGDHRARSLELRA
jgi:hypothetical protein